MTLGGTLEIEDQLGRLVDDADFKEIVKNRSTFNLFEAVGAVRVELRHSNFLRFLLDPVASHGFGSKPLERILRAAISGMSVAKRPVSPLELIVGDLDSALVQREQSYIDLLIEIGPISLVVLIENKIGANAGPGQLKRYREHLERTYPNWRRLLLFLTPSGDLPDDSEYVALSYSSLADIIQTLLNDSDVTDSRIAIRHYVEMLRRHIVPDQNMNQLARRLYERHKAAFDFVFQNMPKPEALFEIAQELVGNAPDLVKDNDGATIVRFIPKTWDGHPALNECPPDKWTKTGRHLLFEIKTFNSDGMRNSVNLSLILGPAPKQLRESIYDGAQRRKFKGLVKPMGEKWSTIFSRKLLSEVQGVKLDFVAKRAAIESSWALVLEEDLPKLSEAVLEIVAGLPQAH
jgi:hypothetical protein